MSRIEFGRMVGGKVVRQTGTAGTTAGSRAATTALPCVHRGRPADAGSGPQWVACDHPVKPLGSSVCTCAGCGPACGGYEPDNAAVGLFAGDNLDPLDIGPYRKNAEAWQRNPIVRDRHKAALLELAGRDFAYPGGEGRGVVCAGGGGMWHQTAVLLAMLRDVGYGGPIECWHWGDHEPVDHALAARFGATVRDGLSLSKELGDNRVPYGVRGWEFKQYALTHTSFEQFVWLDSDAHPLADPSPLFDLMPSGLAYWHEGGWDNAKWDAIGFPGKLPGLPHGFQSGQFVCDKRKFWRQLAIADWMCQHSDYWFSSPTWHVWGDQEAMQIAMALTGFTPDYLAPVRWVHGFGAVCELDGRVFIEHGFNVKKQAAWNGETMRGHLRAMAKMGELFG